MSVRGDEKNSQVNDRKQKKALKIGKSSTFRPHLKYSTCDGNYALNEKHLLVICFYDILIWLVGWCVCDRLEQPTALQYICKGTVTFWHRYAICYGIWPNSITT